MNTGRTRSAVRWLAASSLAASLALSLVAAAAPAQASAPATSHLRALAAPATVLIGDATIVAGAVSPAVAGSPVLLEKLVAGAWHTVATRSPGKTGLFSFKVHVAGKPGTWSLRVVRQASSKATAVIGKTIRVVLTKSAYKLSIAAVTKVTAGNPVVVTGVVTPRTTGQVTLQVLHGGAWHTLAVGRLANSAYAFHDYLPPKTYPLRVVKVYNAAIATGESHSVKVTVYGVPAVSPKLSLSSPDDTLLALPGNRLVFSTIRSAIPPTKAFTFTNSGTGPVTVSGLAIQGADASSFSFAPGQATTLVIPAGGQATVTVQFNPTPSTNCPTTASPYNIGNDNRSAAVVFTSTDPGLPGGSAVVAGINSCSTSGTEEPVLDQVISALGYTTIVDTPKVDRRFLGPAPLIAGTDEVSAPYFTVANPALPVSLVPLAHYSTADTVPYHASGWYLKGATLAPDNFCNASCKQLWAFPADPSLTTFNQNQKLLPVPVGTETFTPTGVFGLYTGEFTDVNFTDDSLNIAHGTDNKDLTPLQYLHDMRVYPAYGPNHVAIPDTYLIAVDVTRVPANKNFDYQDVVMILRNAVPAG